MNRQRLPVREPLLFFWLDILETLDILDILEALDSLEILGILETLEVL